MNTDDGTIPQQKPAMAMKRNTPATVQMKRFTLIPSRSFTSPVNSHIVMPVMSMNNAIIAIGFRKHVTITATKRMPVTARTMKLFIACIVFICVFVHVFVIVNVNVIVPVSVPVPVPVLVPVSVKNLF